MLGSFGVTELIIIFAIILLIFGPKKLPQLGRAIGRTIKGFRGGMRDIDEDDDATTQDHQIPKSSA